MSLQGSATQMEMTGQENMGYQQAALLVCQSPARAAGTVCAHHNLPSA